MLARLSLALLGGFLMLALLYPFRAGTDIDVVAGLATSVFISEVIQRKHETPVRRWTRAAVSALVIGVGFWALKTWVHR